MEKVIIYLKNLQEMLSYQLEQLELNTSQEGKVGILKARLFIDFYIKEYISSLGMKSSDLDFAEAQGRAAADAFLKNNQ